MRVNRSRVSEKESIESGVIRGKWQDGGRSLIVRGGLSSDKEEIIRSKGVGLGS